MKLTAQNKALIENSFSSGNEAHTDLLEKVTGILEQQLSNMRLAEQRVFQGALGWVLASIAEFIPLVPNAYKTAVTISSVWAYEHGRQIYVGRPKYYETLEAANELFDWMSDSRELDCSNAAVQNFLLVLTPLADKGRLNKIEALTQSEKVAKRADSALLSFDTVKNIAVSTWGLFAPTQAVSGKEALPEAFFKKQIATKIRDARNVSIDRYLYGEEGRRLDAKGVVLQGVDYVKATIPGANMLMPGKSA